jgi:hypothetical protein
MDIKELAEQAELITCIAGEWYPLYHEFTHLERFAELIRADEREACAALCDDWHESISFELAGQIRSRK